MTVRAVAVTILSVAFATGAHSSAGGAAPSADLVLTAASLSFAGSLVCLRAVATPAGLGALLLATQGATHLVMRALAGCDQPTASPDAAMTAAHLAAAGLTGLALGHAERALLAILALGARLAARVPVAWPATVVLRPAPRLLTRAHLPARRTSLWLADSLVRRGPPARVAAS